jgi:hypothetical protein
LTAAELAQALGREHAVHAAVAPSGIADRIIAACRRLSGLQVGGLQAGGLQVGAMQAIDAKTELN